MPTARKWEDPAIPFGNLDEIVGIFPTGGTTGPSKGVNVTNLGWGTMIETVGNAVGGRTDKPVNLVVAPLTHAAGPVALATLQIGATQVILPGFDAGAVFEAIQAHGITHMYLPPTALYGLLNHPERDRFDVSSLRVFVLVGSAVSPDKLRQAVEVFGPCMCQAYGQVESPMITCWLPPETVAKAAARRSAGAARELRQAELFGPRLRDGRRGQHPAAGRGRRDLRARRAGLEGIFRDAGGDGRGAHLQLAPYRRRRQVQRRTAISSSSTARRTWS